MAQGAYIGIGGKARKIVGGYVGVSGKARKIVKAYIGIGGKARPCWSANKGVTYYGAITPLSVARERLAAASVGNYALFGGGVYYTGDNDLNVLADTVDAYNTSLTRSTPTALSKARENLAATSVGNYALFGGGSDPGSNTFNTVDAYNRSLTRSTPTALSKARSWLNATKVGNYALFAGGDTEDTVDAYNAYLTRSTPTALSKARYVMGATSVGNYALFAGGSTGSECVATVDAYNTSLTRSTPTVLSKARETLAAASVGNYALFGGGSDHMYTPLDTVDAYNTSLTRSNPTGLSQARMMPCGAKVGSDYAIFAGGMYMDFVEYMPIIADTVDAYDSSLTRTNNTNLSHGMMNMIAATVGNYALFGGGEGIDMRPTDTVDVFTV